MKKLLPFIINGILAIAVVFLFILHFSENKRSNKPQDKTGENVTFTDDLSKSIYYINFDTVLTHYDMYLDMQAQLENKAKTSEAELATKEKQFQKEVTDYQTKAQKGLLLRSEARDIEQQLGAEQQRLLGLQENMRLELAEMQSVNNRKVLDSIMKYLAEIQPKYNFHIVLGTSFGGGVLYASKSLDITWEVISGLNDKYKHERAKKK
jgi:outer membrane protein